MSELENHDEIAELEDMYLEALMEKLAEIEQLQAKAAAMRGALEAVMWASLESGHVYCQWCAVSEGEEHLSDCEGHNALSADAGRELLERLRIVQAQRDDQNEQIRQLERERDEARRALTAVHEIRLAILGKTK